MWGWVGRHSDLMRSEAMGPLELEVVVSGLLWPRELNTSPPQEQSSLVTLGHIPGICSFFSYMFISK